MINFLKKFNEDEEGASLIEYSLLIGLITVVAVALISTMGGWVKTQWSTLVSVTNAGGS